MELDLHRLFRIARRWWWLVVLCAVIGGTVGFTMADRQVRLYSTSAVVLINPAGDIASVAPLVQTGERLAPTYSLWILSDPVLERVDTELQNAGVGGLQGQVSTNVIRNSLFIRISVTDTDPSRAALTANVVAEQFILYVQEQSSLAATGHREDITAQIEVTRQQILDLETEIATLEASADTNEDGLQDMQDQLTRFEEEIFRLRTQQRELDAQIASVGNELVISSPAREPSIPFAPQVRRSSFIGAFTGILLATGSVGLLEYLDNKVRTREEAEALTAAPVLARIPSFPIPKKGKSALFSLERPASPAAEASRLLRANIEFAAATSPLSALTISSTVPGEGKSTITANLGVVMAQAGQKTVIVDADLRHPSQHRIFGIANDQGLTTLLKNPDHDWCNVATPLDVAGLTLLPSGPIPPNPSDLLMLTRFKQVLAQISNVADVVLIDTSPALATSDSLVVASNTDGLILVCTLGHERRDHLQRTTAALVQADIRLVGVVLTEHKDGTTESYTYQSH